MKQTVRKKTERVYVKVNSTFDATGYMSPQDITWGDGRTFHIDEIRDFRPAYSAGNDVHGDCYTIVIGGRERHLFYEKVDPIFHARYGRWFVEKTVYEAIG